MIKMIAALLIAMTGHLLDAPLQWFFAELKTRRGYSAAAIISAGRNVRYLIGGVQVTAVAWLFFGRRIAQQAFAAFAFVGTIVIAMHAGDFVRLWVQAARESAESRATPNVEIPFTEFVNQYHRDNRE